MWKSRRTAQLIALLIVLLAFAVRMWHVDSLQHEYDFGWPHGAGIRITESIRAGDWGSLPVRSFASGIGLANPPAASYFWALVTAFDTDPLTAAAISIMLSVIGVALTYRAARALYSESIGITAALIMACSVWSAYFARGTWMQGQIEAFACLCAWAAWSGVRLSSRRRIFVAGASAALFAQTYLAAFGLIAQVAIALGSAWRTLATPLRRAAACGLAACIVSIGAYAAVNLTSAAGIESAMARASTRGDVESVLIDNPFGIRLDVAGFVRSAQIVSSAGIGDANEPTVAALQAAASIVVNIALLLGAVLALFSARHNPADRAVLLWFLTPALAVSLGSLLFPQAELGIRQYQLLASPAQYVLTARGAVHVLQFIARRTPFKNAAALAGTLLLVASAAARIELRTRFEYDTWPDQRTFETRSLRTMRALADVLRAQCTRVDNPQNEIWLTSILGSSARIGVGRAHASSNSVVWQFSPAGGDCLGVVDIHVQPDFAARIAAPSDAAGSIPTYRIRPIPDDAALLRDLQITTPTARLLNLGWRLIGVQIPTSARTDDDVTVTQAWRIENIPAEPHDDWCYSVFISWEDSQGKSFSVVDNLEHTPLVCGRRWVIGDYIVGRMRTRLPANSAAGPGKLKLTLWDGKYARNAAYLDPGGVAVALEYPLTLLK
jgi:hypothetical protein